MQFNKLIFWQEKSISKSFINSSLSFLLSFVINMEEDMLEIRNLDKEIESDKHRKIGSNRKLLKEKPKMPKALKKKPSSGRNLVLLFIAFLIIIALALFVWNLKDIFKKEDRLIATINGQDIYKSYSDKVLALEIPKNQTITEREFVYNLLVPRILFFQQAKALKYQVTDGDVEEQIDKLFSPEFKREDLIKQLKEKDITYDEFRNLTGENMMISNLLANQVRGKIDVTQQEIEDFYEKYKETFNFTSNFSELNPRIKSAIHRDIYKSKELQGTLLYLSQLIKRSNIIVYEENTNSGQSFKTSNEGVCKRDGKLIIRFFSTSNCEACDLVRIAFKAAVQDYVDRGLVIAYNWQLDTGDDLMTSGKEKAVPKEEFEIYKEFGGDSVPVFVFGCKYSRLGNYYDNLKDEEEEFRAVIEKLLLA